MNGTPEEKIIWKDGGLLQRVEALESGSASYIGGSGASVAPGAGLCTGLAVISEELVEDENGEKRVAVVFGWNGSDPLFELAVKEAS